VLCAPADDLHHDRQQIDPLRGQTVVDQFERRICSNPAMPSARSRNSSATKASAPQ
jgi:hypothetical protein